MAAFVDEEYQRAGYVHEVPHAVHIPPAVLLRHARTLQGYQTGVAGSGAELVATELHPELFIDALRSRSVVMSLGAQTAGGLVGDVQIPRLATFSSMSWLGTHSTSPVLSDAITESEGTVDKITVSPAQLGGYGQASRQLTMQIGSRLFEITFSNDMLQVLATALDIAAIAGAGGNAPTGVVNTSGVNTASGATFAHATAVSAVQTVATAKAIVNRRALGWVADPTTAGLLVQRPKITGFPTYIWSGNVDTGSINGHPALSTTNAPATTAIFGDWSQVLVLSWGADAPVTVELNPFSGNFAGGDIQFRAIMAANVAIRHPTSFVVVSGVT